MRILVFISLIWALGTLSARAQQSAPHTATPLPIATGVDVRAAARPVEGYTPGAHTAVESPEPANSQLPPATQMANEPRVISMQAVAVPLTNQTPAPHSVVVSEPAAPEAPAPNAAPPPTVIEMRVVAVPLHQPER